VKRALSQSQAAELLRAASLLSPATRDEFFAAVDARLIDIPRRLTDDDIGAAIVSTLSTLTITTSRLMCDAAPQQEAIHDPTQLRDHRHPHRSPDRG
jgi:hypothetical protein